MSSKRHKRYFSEISDEKYNVGTLSPKLRQALGLEKDMLPLWIYRMRILGYPPAWLQAAESKTLTVINASSSNDKSNNKQSSSSSSSSDPLKADIEDGEINDLKYNKDTFIEYPGFNCPVPKNVKDDWLILGMPPYQQNQQLSVAVKTMQLIEPVPYKRVKLNDSENDSNSKTSDASSSSKSNDPSTSTDTEDKKSADCLNESSNDSKPNANIEIIDLSSDDEEESSDQETTLETSTSSSSKTSTASTSQSTPVVAENKKMKIVTYGTPVPQTVRPKLPSLEKWSIGMGELMHFENLPNSTGAYKAKIKNIIDKVRKRFQKK